jgi:hypothetical protein
MNRLTDVISADHRELQAYYDRLVNSHDPDEQTRFQNQLTWGLARHVVGEELVLFPALDKYLGPGEATQDRRQNQIVSHGLHGSFKIYTILTTGRSKKNSKSSKISNLPTLASSLL